MAYLSLEDGRALEEAIASLQHGGVIAFPTDTVYGIAASLDHPAALKRIYDLKGTFSRQTVADPGRTS